MSRVSVREATAEDRTTVMVLAAEMLKAEFRDPVQHAYEWQAVERIFKLPGVGFVLIAERDGDAVGMIAAIWMVDPRSSHRYGVELGFFYSADKTDLRICKTLMEETGMRLKAEGAKICRIQVREDNQHKLYEHLGFKHTASIYEACVDEAFGGVLLRTKER